MLQTVNVNCEHAYNCMRKMIKPNVVRLLSTIVDLWNKVVVSKCLCPNLSCPEIPQKQKMFPSHPDLHSTIIWANTNTSSRNLFLHEIVAFFTFWPTNLAASSNCTLKILSYTIQSLGKAKHIIPFAELDSWHICLINFYSLSKGGNPKNKMEI